MNSEDFQIPVVSKYENGDDLTKIFTDLNTNMNLRTIKRCCKSIRDTSAVSLSRHPSGWGILQTKGATLKIKYRLNRRKHVFSRNLSRELGSSRASVQRILKNDLVLQADKLQKQPLLTDEQEEKGIKFVKWILTKFRKGATMKILVSDEMLIDIDRIYNSQNDRVWAVNRSEADARGPIRQERKFPQTIRVCFGACSKST